MKTRIEITGASTAGELRKKLEQLDDSDVIFWQVVAEDGTAWNMFAQAGTAKYGDIFVVSLRHPELKTLPR